MCCGEDPNRQEFYFDSDGDDNQEPIIDGDWMIKFNDDEIAEIIPFDATVGTLYETVCAVWRKPDGSRQITIGFVKCGASIHGWASAALEKGLKQVAEPTLESKCCRCVLMALDQNYSMDPADAFGLKIFVCEHGRKKMVQSKCKGYLRRTAKRTR